MHLPFTPNHVQLITACYPATAALLSSGPDYRPNSQELSRLTYYAANRPGKITKLGQELEKRVRLEARKAHAGNTRSRASLLVTLAIIRALATECRRDIALLSPVLISSVEVVLSSLPADLEVTARAASVFIAWTTYTDGHLVGVDGQVTDNYMTVLKHFARMSSVEAKSKDHEVRNRTRLIGLAAFNGVVTSEALYNSSTHFDAQAAVVVDALLATTHFAPVSELDAEAEDVYEKPTSPFLSEFRARPLFERRAASVHAHIDGEEGPSTHDVVGACLRALSALLSQANGFQIGFIMQAAFNSLDRIEGWEKQDHCRWLAQKMAGWTQYQYRYAVPTRLVERLLEVQDAPTTTPAHRALCIMISTVFTSPTPLINLSTSDIISNLITLVMRRVTANPDDALLPALVECIASLGTHVYYADQIQDLAGELISRLTVIEVNGVPGRAKAGDGSRSQAIRCLLLGLVGLIQAADSHEMAQHVLNGRTSVDSKSPLIHSASDASEKSPHVPARTSRRSKVTPEVWQDTLTLLCDGDYAVRADYADALILYLASEVSKTGETTDSDGVRRVRPLADGPMRQASNLSAALWGDPATRFLNATHAYLYILATSLSLGLNYGTQTTSSPSRSTNGDTQSSVQNGDADESFSATRSQTHRPSTAPSRARKPSVARRMLEHTPQVLSASAAATASDYAHILTVLTAIHEQLPVRGLLTGIPMLIALQRAASDEVAIDAEAHQRLRAVREVLARVWVVIGRVWECPEVAQVANKALSSMSHPSSLPALSEAEGRLYHSPKEPVYFTEPDPDAAPEGLEMNTEVLLLSISANSNVLDATGLDKESVLAKLSRPWSAELAMKDSVEPDPNTLRADSMGALLKVAPALMHIENLSLASLSRPTRGVGVTDLREALSGRGSMSNSALVNKAPSVSTLDYASSILPHNELTATRSRGAPKKRALAAGPSEVRDVLNRLGIGKQNGSGLLRTPSNALQGSGAKRNIPPVPPYRS